MQLAHEKSGLDELNVFELGVPEDMRVGDDDAGACVFVLEKSDGCNVVSTLDSVEHGLAFLKVWASEGYGIEFNALLLDEGEADGTVSTDGRAMRNTRLYVEDL